jgi:hypothetical protein
MGMLNMLFVGVGGLTPFLQPSQGTSWKAQRSFRALLRSGRRKKV